jgi:hypothetical protein
MPSALTFKLLKSKILTKTVSSAARILVGIVFAVLGRKGFLHFIPMSPPPAGFAVQYLGALAMSHYLTVVFAFQLVAGIVLLACRLPSLLPFSGSVPCGMCAPRLPACCKAALSQRTQNAAPPGMEHGARHGSKSIKQAILQNMVCLPALPIVFE